VFKVGDQVVYEEKSYSILHIYETNYVEIKRENTYYDVQLVHTSELLKTNKIKGHPEKE